MRKTIKRLIAIASLIVLCPLSKAQELTVCAVPQTYNALEQIRQISPIKFNTFYAVSSEIYSMISNNNGSCDLVISSDEKLPILLIRSNLADLRNKRALVKAPLLLWSKNPDLLNDTANAVKKKQLKSISIPDAKLTPVGFASHEIVSKTSFPTNYLKAKGNIYRASHEYAVFAMVDSTYVQVGFLTKPLIMKDGQTLGSYWQIPNEMYPEIIYYSVISEKGEKNNDSIHLIKFLHENKQSLECFIRQGFEPL